MSALFDFKVSANPTRGSPLYPRRADLDDLRVRPNNRRCCVLTLPSFLHRQSFLVTLLLFICTCTYVKMKAPQLMDSHKVGLRGLFWKAARVGERLSPWVATSCVVMGVHTFWTGGGK